MKLPRLSLLGLLAAATIAFGADTPSVPPAAGNAAPVSVMPLPSPAKVIPLYPGAAPGSENWTWEERPAGSPSNPTIQNVVHPELMYYPADKAKAVGTAMIVAPSRARRGQACTFALRLARFVSAPQSLCT